MPSKQVALEVAAFVDSPHARELRGVAPADARRIVEEFVELCYAVIGKAPRLLDAEDARELLTQLLPARLGANDPLAQRAPDVLSAYLEHLDATQVVTQAFELRRAFEDALPQFVEAVASGRHAGQLASAPREPFVHGADKVGRNDPCWCGSGKKFKKCHGKGA